MLKSEFIPQSQPSTRSTETYGDPVPLTLRRPADYEAERQSSEPMIHYDSYRMSFGAKNDTVGGTRTMKIV
jgi:hypothetical protein